MVSLRLETILDDNGEWIKSEQNAHFLDTILVILTEDHNTTINKLNLELRRCGFFATLPTLKAVLQYLMLKGFIKNPINGA